MSGWSSVVPERRLRIAARFQQENRASPLGKPRSNGTATSTRADDYVIEQRHTFH
jgi:hypothetical protein